MRKLLAFGVVALWLGALSCGEDSSVGTSGDSGSTGTTGTTGMVPGVDTTAGPQSSDGAGSADGTGAECSLSNVEVCEDDDPCTADDCFDGACTHEPAADDTPCTARDGMAGSCQEGACVVQCSSDAECDDANVCTIDSCDLAVGQCTFEELDGVEADASEQTDGDCQVVECEAGVAVDNPDNGDDPDDGNDCTDDDCSGGRPTFTPLGAGAACGVDGLCDGMGACVDCLSPMDCTNLPPDDDCQIRTCTDGVCGQDFAPQGTAVNATLQTSGNCQEIVCDGAGDMESVDDDADLPIDGMECTDDVCNAGLPFNPPAPSGTDCAAGVCNATGVCVGCLVPADCGGTNTFCQTITCIANTCGVTNTVGGIPLPAGQQTPNDCQEVQCDGNGMTQAVADNADEPADDGSQCTDEICTNGLPQHPDLPVDTACNQDGGIVCDGAGACVECNDGAQCSNAGQCQVDACNANVCVPEPGPAGGACNDGQFCTVTDTCDGAGGCTGVGSPCQGPDMDNNCNETCDEVADSCTAPDPVGSSCDDGLFCTGTDTCNAAGNCVGTGTPCQGADGDVDCMETCNEVADSCNLPDPNGSPCDDGFFCTTTDSCVAGVCQGAGTPCQGADGDGNCAESCDETLDNCAGNDPMGTACSDGMFCTGAADTCNGAGACVGSGNPCAGADGDINCSESCDETADNCLGNDPGGALCDDGLFCTQSDMCNGAGACTGTGDPCGAASDTDCAACNEVANDCSAAEPSGSTCDDNLFCNGADTCNGAGACGTHEGNPCGLDSDTDCAACSETQDDCSGAEPMGSFCEDGLFCTGGAGGDACNASGTCVPSANPCAGPDGDANCAESCDEALQNCFGNDPGGTSCSDGTFCNGAETCNGAGACLAGTLPCGDISDANCSACREAQADCNGSEPSGSPCNDGLHCNGTDTCGFGGVCTNHTGDPCNGGAGGDCSNSCNEASNNCTANDPLGTSCDDSTFCNGADTCNGSGSCSHAGDPCLPLNTTNIDCSESCNEMTDACTANDPNGTACNDGVFCNGADTCSGGACSVHPGDPCGGPDGDCNCEESCDENADNCQGNDPTASSCDGGLGFCNAAGCCNGLTCGICL